MKYTVAIVEDEKHQQDRIIALLQEHFPDLEIAGIAATVDDAYTLLAKVTPHLVFMDVMLPPYTSFDLLQKLERIPFEIIFTTSYEEFAVKAFRLSAVDYLLKPVVPEELQQAVQRFRDKMERKSPLNHLQVLMNNLQLKDGRQKRIALPTLTGYIFVSIEDIIRCESDNTYTTFHLLDKRKIVVSKTLKECEAMLADFSFFRVHNSNLINLDHIVEYAKGEGGVVKMIDGSHVDVSRRRKEDFVRLFKKTGMEKN